jgi:hypothetical protein
MLEIKGLIGENRLEDAVTTLEKIAKQLEDVNVLMFGGYLSQLLENKTVIESVADVNDNESRN